MTDVNTQVQSKAEEWTARLKKLAEKVPGLKEFMGRDEIREQDKILREYTAKKIDEIKAGIDEVKKLMLAKMQLSWLPDLDRLTQQIDRLRDKQRFAAHGYSGAFDVKKVLEPELRKLLETDMAILAKTEAILKNCDLLCGANDAEEALKASLAALKIEISELAKLIDNRGETVAQLGL